MAADRIILVQNNGKTVNIGKDFKSYDFGTVDKCAQLFLGDEARRYQLLIPKMGKEQGAWEWDCNKVTLYAPATPAAHETVLRFCHLGRVKELDGYCFVVTLGGSELAGVFDNVPDLFEYVAGLPESLSLDVFIRIVPYNKELN